MELVGEVITGQGFEHKPPTANVAMREPVPVGCYIGQSHLGDELLGKSAVWVLPHQPHIAEVYVSNFDGDLYGSFLKVDGMKKLGRGEIVNLYNKALSDE